MKVINKCILLFLVAWPLHVISMEKEAATWKRIHIVIHNNTGKDYLAANALTLVDRAHPEKIESWTIPAGTTDSFSINVPREELLQKSLQKQPLRIVQIVNAKDMNDSVYFYVTLHFMQPAIIAIFEAEANGDIYTIGQTQDLTSMEKIDLEITLGANVNSLRMIEQDLGVR